MGSSRRNFNTGYQIVKQNFQTSVADLFEKQYHGTLCNNALFINILFCALCLLQCLVGESEVVFRDVPQAIWNGNELLSIERVPDTDEYT